MVRPLLTVGPVTVVFVLRLVEEALADGQVVGRVERVESGESATCRDLRELLDFLCRRDGRDATSRRVTSLVALPPKPEDEE